MCRSAIERLEHPDQIVSTFCIVDLPLFRESAGLILAFFSL